MSETLSAPPEAPTDTYAEKAPTLTKNQQFRALLESDQVEFILEAHNGISARIGEEAGFKGLWGSGLCLSAQYGVRDNNEASWTQVLEMVEFMSDATSIPLMLDGDTGYGNFNNMRRLVRKLEQRDVSAVCIEDKLFPKTNSFISGHKQQLADMDEFCGKIKAGKDAQQDDEFSIVARVEALIAGWGLAEALRRAEAYHGAGADAILIHSSATNADEILQFKHEWDDRCPVVIVPTKYYKTPTDVFRDYGFSIVIWANHILRSAVAAMQEAAAMIARDENLLGVEERAVPVKEIFRLQGASELEIAERMYLPERGATARAVVLAASRGSELGELTEDKPKAMVKVQGEPLLSHIVSTYQAVGINGVTVVRGYEKDAVQLPNLMYVDNDDYDTTGELYSLHLALEEMGELTEDLVVSYGDVLFRKYILEALTETDEDFAIPVDANWMESVNRYRTADYVRCSMPNSRRAFYSQVTLAEIGEDLPHDETHGEWMGLLKVSEDAVSRFKKLVAEICAGEGGKKATIPTLLQRLADQDETVRVLYSTGHWLDVDSVDDIVAAGSFE
ncbi:MAG: phosphoenolpyruvate mutase [Longimicrobiales bacterium]|nr:phosphoenolpyruvate mutase [Longimicrobiales bacterium]